MHRHGYQGTKFHRERDQRRALIKSLAESLIKYESIETTHPKAKAVVPYVEKLITKAKKADLHNRRQIISKLQTVEVAHKLVDEMAPKMTKRSSGHLRIEKTTFRRGDHAQMSRVSFVDDLKSTTKKSDDKEVKTTKPVAKTHDKDTEKSKALAKPTQRATSSNAKAKTGTQKVAKRSGVRGNK